MAQKDASSFIHSLLKNIPVLLTLKDWGFFGDSTKSYNVLYSIVIAGFRGFILILTYFFR